MSPAISPLVSALERAADLIDKGAKPASALRQVAREMTLYADAYAQAAIPAGSFASRLAEFSRGNGSDGAQAAPKDRVI